MPAESPLLSPGVRDGTTGVGDERAWDAERRSLSIDSPQPAPTVGEAAIKGARAASATKYGAARRPVSKRLVSRGWVEDGEGEGEGRGSGTAALGWTVGHLDVAAAAAAAARLWCRAGSGLAETEKGFRRGGI